MLFRQSAEGNYEQWNIGIGVFFLKDETPEVNIHFAVQCRFGNLEETELALLDTGAEWSVIGGQLREQLADQLGVPLGEIGYHTRKYGLVTGQLHNLSITFVAEEGRGEDLTVNGTVVVIQEWADPPVIGYRGVLERIRFALEPSINADSTNQIYFGTLD